VNVLAQNGSNYLVEISLSDTELLNKLEELDIPIHHQQGSSLITVLSSTQLAEIENGNMEFFIIDENPVIENYMAISNRDLDVGKVPNIFEYIIYENDNLCILKNYNSELFEQHLPELNLTRLSNSFQLYINERYLPTDYTSDINDSIITNIVSKINPDSIAHIIQSLQDFETRFLMTENRFDAADWIKDKFIQIGFNDVKYDTFMCHTNWQGIDTTTIQVNVVATLQGTIRPDEIFIMGGHYDSYCYGDPFIWAPGADDDASGTAAVLESARAIIESGYLPEATIKFICFGAEELMYFGDAGSEHYAQQAYNSGMDIKLMVNNDMISHTLFNVNNSYIAINYYSGFEDLLEVAKSVTEQYTVLTPVNGNLNQGADSYPFYQFGYPPIYFEERDFSPYYHQPSDTIGNYDMEYCAEVIKSSCATLLSHIVVPSPVKNYQLADGGNGSSLYLNWEPNAEPDVNGYKIYVGTSTGVYDSTFTTVDTTYILDGLIEGNTYYVGVSAYDVDGNESIIVERNAIPLVLPLPPAGFTALPLWHQVELNWNANLEFDLMGYNIYRSDIEGALGDKQNSSIYTDTIYVDLNATNGVYYYYTVKAVDNQLNESENNTTLRSRVVSLDMGVLIV
ncbi:MAG: M20/M25/M40 family metallo-hydrolase, partial [Ignavibacteriaceae bacterium]|nr:M20/M25/M40 family metallo-hydrolase [Ignavibacteriaceae bacterium]